MTNCAGCSIILSSASGTRRRLSTDSSQHVKSVLTEVLDRIAPHNESVTVSMLEKYFVCVPCFRSLERISKLRKDLEKAFQGACDKAELALPFIVTDPSNTVAASDESLPHDELQQPQQQQQQETDEEPGPPAKRARFVAPVSGEETSPAVSVTVNYKRPKTYLMTPTRKTLCKNVARGSYKALARRCLDNENIRKYVICGVGRILRKEVAVLCSDKVKSVLRNKSNVALQTFQWKQLEDDMNAHAPTLLTLLRACTQGSKTSDQQKAYVGVITAILCKNRRTSASLIQRLISIILYSGHASKKVFVRLQRLGVCMAHSTTIKLLDQVGADFDSKVLSWKSAVESELMPLLPTVQDTAATTPSLLLGNDESSNESSNGDTSLHSDQPAYVCLNSMAELAAPMSICPSSSSSDSDGGSTTSQSATSDDAPLNFSLLSNEEESSETVSTVDVSDSHGHDPPKLYKLVFDNINKTVAPRHMRSDVQTRSLNYVQIYCVKSRIDFSPLSLTRDEIPASSSLFDILPSATDYKALKESFARLVARTIHEHIPFFGGDFKGLIPAHTPHQYSDNMAVKSEVVPLGVLPKSEMSYEDMTVILSHIQSYIPSRPIQTVLNMEPFSKVDYQLLPTLVGGDQLSVARARGCILIQSNAENRFDKLSGILPVSEDWHAKVCFMQVICKRLYNPSSCMERGTLFQLKSILNRRNISTDVKGHVNQYEDFFEVIFKGHVISAALQHLGMPSLDALPDPAIVDTEIWLQDDNIRQQKIMEIASSIVEKYVDLATEFAPGNKVPRPMEGSRYEYARETLSLTLLLMEFKDAIREGDGDRVMAVWKYLFLLFKSSGRTNYTIEAFILLSQQQFLLPPMLAHQQRWSRFVNCHGAHGRNVSMDLHMEHLNRICKTSIQGLGANKSTKAIIRVGKTIGVLDNLMSNFDADNNVGTTLGSHKARTQEKDLKTVIKQLLDIEAFNPNKKIVNKSFGKLSTNLIRTLDETKVKEWMVDHFAQLMD